MAVVTGCDLTHLMTSAVNRHFGTTMDPSYWDFRMVSYPTDGDARDRTVSIHRNAHPTEGTRRKTDYVKYAATVLPDGSWQANPVLHEAIERIVGIASRLDRRDRTIRAFWKGRPDYAEPPMPVLRDGAHIRQPPAWAYAIDRTVKLIGLSAGRTVAEMSTPAGCSFDHEGRPSSRSIHGLQLVKTMSTLGDGTNTTLEGGIHGSVVEARVEVLRTTGPGLRCYGMAGSQVIEVLGMEPLPATVLQGMIGMDLASVMAIAGLPKTSGVSVMETAQTGGILYLTVTRRLEPLDTAPEGVDTTWMED